MSDILEKLIDLHKQATTERSHYYVASVAMEAIKVISQLEAELATAKLQAPLRYKPTIEEVIELHKQPYREVWHPDFMDCALERVQQLEDDLTAERGKVFDAEMEINRLKQLKEVFE